jgi:DNA-binding NarL/FixJ family response regulator
VGKLVRLVLADAHPVVAEGLGMILAAEADFAVCGVAHDGCRVVELAAVHRPTVLLLDAHLPGGDPAETLIAVQKASPTTRVLLLSAYARGNTVAAALAGGAAGVVAKGGSCRQLSDAIRRVVDGKRAMVVAAKPPQPPRDLSVEQLRGWTLSNREREVLALLASGWPIRRIAEQLEVSPATVRSHVQNVLVKLGVHGKLEAVVFAFEHGIVPTGGVTWGRHSA